MRKGFVMLLVLGLLLIPGCGKPATKTDAGTVTVTTVDSDGTALKDVSVIMKGTGGTSLTGVSDEQGKTVFNNVAYGDYEISSTKSGYSAGSGSVSVSDTEQETEITMESGSASTDGTATVDIDDSSVLNKLQSYRYSWTVRDMGATATTSMEGGFEKPDSEYFITRDKDGKSTMEFYKVNGTAKVGTGTSWQTLEGDAAKDTGFGDSFVSTLSDNYSFVREHEGWQKSNGGSVNGYDTDRYTYTYSVSGATTKATVWIIRSGDFKGVITRYEVASEEEADKTKTSVYTMNVSDLGKPLGIKLP